MLTFNKKTYSIKLMNVLIGLFPLSYALGNLMINLNTIFVIIFGLYLFKSEVFKTKNTNNIFLYIFFFTIILSTAYNFFFNQGALVFDKMNIVKSLFFLRYLLLFLVVGKLVELGLFKLKYFFVASVIISTFLGIDLIVEYHFSKDLFGNVTDDPYRLSGFFGKEKVAGSYLLNFGIFSTFIIIFFKKDINLSLLFFLTSFIFFFVCMSLTGSRMALLLFVMNFLFIFLIEKELLKKFLFVFLAIIVVFALLFNFNTRTKMNTINFIFWAKPIITYSIQIFYKPETSFASRSTHLNNFKYGLLLWKKNKIFGNGLRSSRQDCTTNPELRFKQKAGFILCNNHPHNYYIELLADTGLFGVALFCIIFFSSFYKFLKLYIKNKTLKFDERLQFLIPFALYFSYIFPFKSSGSVFSTNVATMVFLLLAIIANCKSYLANKIK